MVLVACPNESERTRVGVAAGKSVGSAVVRNRAKRLLRAAASSLYQQITPGWDLLLIARTPLAETDFNQARPALNSLLLRARLLKAETGHDRTAENGHIPEEAS